MKVMPMREFLRGGYQKIDGPTVISKNGLPVFTILPTNWSTTFANRPHTRSEYPYASTTFTSSLSTNKTEE